LYWLSALRQQGPHQRLDGPYRGGVRILRGRTERSTHCYVNSLGIRQSSSGLSSARSSAYGGVLCVLEAGGSSP
jgi:hypothetical protein